MIDGSHLDSHGKALLMLSLMAAWAKLYLAHNNLNKSYNLINTLLTLTATCAARISLTSTSIDLA